jgi:hypothetical protein
MRVAARQHLVAHCGRQDGGVSPALPALHAAFSSTATFFYIRLMLPTWIFSERSCSILTPGVRYKCDISGRALCAHAQQVFNIARSAGWSLCDVCSV